MNLKKEKRLNYLLPTRHLCNIKDAQEWKWREEKNYMKMETTES